MCHRVIGFMFHWTLFGIPTYVSCDDGKKSLTPVIKLQVIYYLAVPKDAHWIAEYLVFGV